MVECNTILSAYTGTCIGTKDSIALTHRFADDKDFIMVKMVKFLLERVENIVEMVGMLVILSTKCFQNAFPQGCQTSTL